jgi:putative transcriptional regulator
MHAVVLAHAFVRAAKQADMTEDEIAGHHKGNCRRISGKGRIAMGKKAFDKIAEGLSEALAIARGEAKPAKLHIPTEIDVKAIRTKLALSQDDFAARFGFTTNQIRHWEQGRSRPLGGVRAYLTIIDRNPESVLALLRSTTSKRAA